MGPDVTFDSCTQQSSDYEVKRLCVAYEVTVAVAILSPRRSPHSYTSKCCKSMKIECWSHLYPPESITTRQMHERNWNYGIKADHMLVSFFTLVKNKIIFNNLRSSCYPDHLSQSFFIEGIFILLNVNRINRT